MQEKTIEYISHNIFISLVASFYDADLQTLKIAGWVSSIIACNITEEQFDGTILSIAISVISLHEAMRSEKWEWRELYLITGGPSRAVMKMKTIEVGD